MKEIYRSERSEAMADIYKDVMYDYCAILIISIVVEGVETAEMLKLFSDLECEYIQGYYFSKPIPREEFVKFIQASS